MQTRISEPNHSLDPRIQTWIDTILPDTPEALRDKNTPKRGRGKLDNGARPSKRTIRQALIPTAGNIMASPERSKQQPQQLKTPRRAAFKETKTSHQPDEEETPRATRRSSRYRGGIGTVPLLEPPRSSSDSGNCDEERSESNDNVAEDQSENNEDSSVKESSVKDSNNSRRSQSPSKIGQLAYAQRKTRWPRLDARSAEQAGGFLTRYQALRAIGQGNGVIPFSLKRAIEDHVEKEDQPEERCYMADNYPIYARKTWYVVQEVYDEAHRCVIKGESEAGWNTSVHKPLLKSVVEHPKHKGSIIYANVTSANIFPADLHVKYANGDLMGGQKVDYVLALNTEEVEDRIAKTILLLSKKSQFLNQTNHSVIEQNPIFVNLETKIPNTGGQKANVQLATWGYAGFTKVHQLLRANGHPTEAIPAVPMLSAHGHDWHLSALYEKGNENIMVGRLAIGSTETIQGIFQIMKALDELATWGVNEYKPWYLKNVVKA